MNEKAKFFLVLTLVSVTLIISIAAKILILRRGNQTTRVPEVAGTSTETDLQERQVSSYEINTDESTDKFLSVESVDQETSDTAVIKTHVRVVNPR